MKKIYFWLIAVLLIANSSFAQTTITIGAGTTASGTNDNGNPIYRSSATSLFGWSISGHVYTAAQLAAMASGSTITSFAFKKTSAFGTASGRDGTMKVYMRNSTATTLPTTTTLGTVQAYTLVYTNATQTIPATAGFVTITLATPLVYTGGSLEIYVDWAVNGASSGLSTGAFLWEYSIGTNQVIGNSNNAAFTSASTFASAQAARSYNLQLTYTAAVPCTGTPAPGNTVASATSVCAGSTVNLSLQNAVSGSGVTYDWQSSSDGTTYVSTGITTSTYSPVVSAATYYKSVVTCTNTSSSATSTPVLINTEACNYTTAYTTGISYNSIATTGTSATWQNTSGDDNTTTNITLPFAFRFKGVNYTVVNACTNGWLSLGATTATSYTNTLSSTTNGSTAMLSPFWDDLVVTGQTSANLPTSFKYTTTGITPSRVFTAEWIGLETFNNPGPNLNFQVKLYETTNKIEYVYGTMEGFNGTASSTYSYSLGLRNSAADYISLQKENTNYFSTSVVNDALIVTPDCNVMYSFNGSGTFTTGSNPSAIPPVNDEATGAVTLSVNSAPCTAFCGTYYNTANATASASIPVCSAATPGTPDDDVWFKFVATTASQNINVFGGGGYDAVIQLFSDAGITSITCKNATAVGFTETINATGLTPANTYYVRVYNGGIGNGTTTQVSICVSEVILPPVNDEICAAISLPVNANCVTTTGTTIAATASTTTPAACNTADDDIWYKFVATSASNLITVQSLTGFNASVQILSSSDNTCTGTLTQEACVNLTSTGGVETYSGTLVTGKTYFVRVYNAPAGAGSGNFTICVSAPVPLCVVNTAPAAAAVDQSLTPTLTWPSSLSAVSYDVYFGTTNPPSTLLTNVTTTTYTIPGAGPLTPATVYYWYISPKNANGNAVGCDATNTTSFTTGTPPSCTTTTTPTNGATGVAFTPSVALAWNAASGATSYDVYYGTTNPPTTLIGNTPGTSVSVTGSLGSTTYYWYIVPKNGGGAATGCSSTVSSFTTVLTCDAPTSVAVGSIASTTASVSFVSGGSSFIVEYGPTGFTPGTGAAAGGVTSTIVTGAISPIALSGLTASTTYQVYVRQDCSANALGYSANSTVVSFTTLATPPANDNASGAVSLTVGAGCTTNPYNNTNATQSAGEPFPSCKGTAGFAGMWYSFVAPASGTVKISCDGTGTLGDSRIALYSATNPANYTTFSIIACDDDNGIIGGTRSLFYAAGLTAGITYYVNVDLYSSSAVRGTYCVTVDEIGSTMIATTAADCVSDQGSVASYNAAYTGWVSLVDGAGNINANVRQNTGTATGFSSSRTIKTGVARTVNGVPYMNRNFLINGTGATAADVQFFFTDAELANLGSSLANLQISRVPGTTCNTNFAGLDALLVQTLNGSANGVSFIQVATPGFSNFYLRGSGGLLPVSIEFLKGTKQTNGNLLDWKVNCTSVPNIVMELERSADGRRFNALKVESATAVRCQQGFNYTDAAPLAGINYYRLKVTEPTGEFRYSNIIAILNKDKGFELISIAPNPVRANAILTLSSAKAGKVEIAISDIAGKVVAKQSNTVIAGSNPINMNFATLGAGTYGVTATNADGETRTTRFVKY